VQCYELVAQVYEGPKDKHGRPSDPKLYVRDGVWEVSDLDFIKTRTDIPNPDIELVTNFIRNAGDNLRVANAYETSTVFLLNGDPKPFKGGILCVGFEGHGTTALLMNCPKHILILGEND